MVSTDPASVYGVKAQSELNNSKYFHVVDGLPSDIMHDILEEVLPLHFTPHSDIYATIFEKHQYGFVYSYTPEAKERYTEYANDLSEKMNAQWEEGNICTDNFSKDKRNFIRYKKCVSP
jgi:hypothetical protein